MSADLMNEGSPPDPGIRIPGGNMLATMWDETDSVGFDYFGFDADTPSILAHKASLLALVMNCLPLTPSRQMQGDWLICNARKQA